MRTRRCDFKYILYLKSQGTKHPAAVSRTCARFVTINRIFAGRSGTGNLDTELVDAPTIALVALYSLEFAGYVVALRHELRRVPDTEGSRSSHSCLSKLLASGQFAWHAAKAAHGFAAPLVHFALTLKIILAGRCSRRTHVPLVKKRTSTGDRSWRLCAK